MNMSQKVPLVMFQLEFINYVEALLDSRYADQVLIDDEILVEKYNELIPKKVTNMSNIVMEGNTFHCIKVINH